ncbi:DUF6357 family protein [Amycolatopsis lurida]|uniref:DUF6357 family protein n=1 Tax=Amycolatopsis lurida TaxID=31959 RepID=UPI0036511104
MLLWSAILPLCEAAGIRGPLDESAAVALLDPILLGEPDDGSSFKVRTSGCSNAGSSSTRCAR